MTVEEARTLVDNVTKEIQRVGIVEKILLNPSVISFLSFEELRRWNELGRKFQDQIANTPESIGYWSAMCVSFASQYGLCSLFDVQNHGAHSYYIAKKHFFSELWPMRNKWKSTTTAMTESNSIKIAVRFRPENRGAENINLHLHQFLKVKRAKLGVSLDSIIVGAADPQEFLDPLMGTLMKEPVLLLTSSKICDRSVAVASILRGGRDPFNGRRLTLDQLVPQPQLISRIAAWRAEKEEKLRDVSVSLDDSRTLVDANTVDPDLLELIQQVESMAILADRATCDAQGGKSRTGNGRKGSISEDENQAIGFDGDDVFQTEGPEVVNNTNDENAPNIQSVIKSYGGLKVGNDSSDDIGMYSNRAEKPRIIDINTKNKSVSVCEPGSGIKGFHFQQVYDGATSQSTVHEHTARPAIISALNALNATILCYGQTGSGKTFTFFGPEGALDADIERADDCSHAGLLVRSLIDIFDAKSGLEKRGLIIALSAQYVEIFEEACTDLITGNACQIRRETGAVVGAEEFVLNDMDSAINHLRIGQARKRFAATAMNDRSSRSHTVFILHLSHFRRGSDDMLKSCLSFCDLAGSERVKKSQVAGARLKEAIGINNSLLVLGKCIQALVTSSRHVPYYESKLTTLLKGSFGGNSRTSVVTCCRQADAFGDETLWALRFSERCSLISNFSRVAASSVQTAISSLEYSLESVEKQLKGLEQRGFSHLDSYAKLQTSYKDLQLKRRELAHKTDARTSAQ